MRAAKMTIKNHTVNSGVIIIRLSFRRCTSLLLQEGPGSISSTLWYLPPSYNTFRRDLRPCYYPYRHQAHMWYTDILLAFIYILIYMKYI